MNTNDRSETPLARIGVALHDDALDLGAHAMIARGHDGGGHERDGERHRLALGGHDHDLLLDLDAVVVAQHAGQEDLGAVADRVDRAVLEYDALVGDEERLERPNDATQVALVLVVVVSVLGVDQIVHAHHVVRLGEDARAAAAQLLHDAAGAEEQAEVHAQCAHIRARLAAHPEDGHVLLGVELDQLALVDGAYAQVALDRGNDGRSLEEGARERLEALGDALGVLDGRVEAHDADVLLAGALLRLDEAGGALDAHDQAAGDLGVESARVTLFVLPHAFQFKSNYI